MRTSTSYAVRDDEGAFLSRAAVRSCELRLCLILIGISAVVFVICVPCVRTSVQASPQAVTAQFGDEVYPGENILDDAGNRVDATRTLFAATNAGGRAAFALESVAAMDYLFDVKTSSSFTTHSAVRRP